MRRDIQALKGATTELQRVEQRRPNLNEAVEEAHQTAESCQREHEKAKSQIEQDKIMLDSHLAGRPGFFSRLFATAAWKLWRSTLQKLSATLQQSVLRAQETDGALELARTEWSNTNSTRKFPANVRLSRN